VAEPPGRPLAAVEVARLDGPEPAAAGLLSQAAQARPPGQGEQLPLRPRHLRFGPGDLARLGQGVHNLPDEIPCSVRLLPSGAQVRCPGGPRGTTRAALSNSAASGGAQTGTSCQS
jgi:hypothetical protein